MLGLRFCVRVFSSCSEWEPLFIAVHGPLTIAASLVAEHRLQTRRLSNCGSRAQLLRGMWDPPRPGLKPVSPALVGRVSTTAPPAKPLHCCFLTAPPLFLHSLPSLISNCLNLPFGTQGKSRWLNKAYFLQTGNRGHGFEPWSGKIPHAAERLGL